jgi:transcription termination factor Rho
MNERRRPHRRGRGPRPFGRQPSDSPGEPNPYRDTPDQEFGVETAAPTDSPGDGGPEPTVRDAADDATGFTGTGTAGPSDPAAAPASRDLEAPPQQQPQQRPPRPDNYQGQGNQPNQQHNHQHNGRRQQHQPHEGRGRRNRGRGPRREHAAPQGPPAPIVPDGDVVGWFDSARDGGYIRRAANSYLAESGDPFVPVHLVRQYALRRGDAVIGTTGRDARGRTTLVEATQINDADPAQMLRRPDFGSLTASYPDRKLTLETGRPAKGGPELTRRAIDLIAPIGYGQRALIVAPARAGKTMLLQAITEGVAVNHPNAVLLVLLVDERPEEVSEMITWGYGEVVASSFDMPAERHVDVADMVLERARRLVEMGKDVVIVLDSITRLARAHNTVERGTGRTLSGGLDATAMARPKAFFGSARAVAEQHGGGSVTIIATALVETGSRMDDVIFEEFKGTGNCEIKLDRSLAEKRIFPAIDIATSGTRREEKLFRPDQLDGVYTLRRGLQQMPPQSAMEWLIKRIAATTNNDSLLTGL